MSKKLVINGYNLAIAPNGNLHFLHRDAENDCGDLVATAAELRRIAAESERLHTRYEQLTALAGATPKNRIERVTVGYEVSFYDEDLDLSDLPDGAVGFGCQTIPYADVQRVAALSAARAARKPAAPKRK